MSFEGIPLATSEDLAAIDLLIKPPEPPERIYGWLHSQMSIAKYYGGLDYQGHQYFIAPLEEGQPLVRADVLKREAVEKAKLLVVAGRARRYAAKQAQGGLL